VAGRQKMVTLSVQEAQKDFSAVITQVQSGEEIVLCDGGIPVAKLSGITEKPPLKKPRVPGSMIGKITIPPEFYDPLPDDILKEFGL
jgi:antitoxin (DNA-binding transcriptional repressor) of toxin-antitoxin stability system